MLTWGLVAGLAVSALLWTMFARGQRRRDRFIRAQYDRMGRRRPL